MKIKSILSTAFVALLLASCSGSGADKSAATTPENMAKADSLVYFYGQTRAAEYARAAQNDTVLDTEVARQEYLRGMKAGLDAVKYGKDAYNRGLFQGIQTAMNFQQFEEDYDIRLSNKKFMDGLSEALNADSVVDAAKLQSTFHKLMNEFNKAKEERDKVAAQSAVKAAGEALGMKEISDQLWGSVPESADPKIKDGDRIKFDIVITTLAGKDIKSPFPKELTVGQRMSNNPITSAFTSLASGQTGSFVTSAHDLFGARSQQLGLKPADALKLTVTPTIVEQPKAQ